jgi:hypothetical protein
MRLPSLLDLVFLEAAESRVLGMRRRKRSCIYFLVRNRQKLGKARSRWQYNNKKVVGDI